MCQWLLFFLVAIKEKAEKAVATLEKIVNLKQQLEREFILPMGRKAPTAQLLLDNLFSKPVITAKQAAEFLGLTPKSTNILISQFIEGNILKEVTGMQRGRIFTFEKYVRLFEK